MVWIVFLFCIVEENFRGILAQQDVIQRGIALAVAKGKEIIDHGVNVESERKNSVDFFGLKFGTNNGVHSGFGDAATEKNVESFEEDLERKKRTVRVLDFLHSNGLFRNPSSGTNVNIVKVTSVSNVNNYGPMPTATTAAARRRRSPKVSLENPMTFEKLDEKIAFVTSDSEIRSDGSFKRRSIGEVHEGHLEKLLRGLPDDIDDAEMVTNHKKLQNKLGNKESKEYQLMFKKWNERTTSFKSESEMKSGGSMKTHSTSLTDDFSKQAVALGDQPEEKSRAKRSPQDADMPDSSTAQPRCGGKRGGPPGQEGANGSQRGPGRRGGGGRGGKGGGRGPPPPPPDDDDGEGEDLDENTRAKREIRASAVEANQTGNESGDSSYYSDSSSSESDEEDSDSESHETSETPGTMMVAHIIGAPEELTRDKRSPCGRRTTVMTTVAARRRKRETTPEEETTKVKSWFSTVVDVIVESARKLAAVTRRVFSRDQQGNAEAAVSEMNYEVETMD